MQLTEDQITDYLRTDPQFFERNAHLLTEIYLPSPHGNGTVSLAERQQLAQRDKIRVLEVKLAELLQFGEENDAIGEKVHRLCLAMLGSPSFDILMRLVVEHLHEDFMVPHVAIRLWAPPVDKENAGCEEFSPLGEELRGWAQGLTVPYCGHHPGPGLDDLFGSVNAPLKSYALVALRGGDIFGLLAMASEDEQRFYPEMGTVYLKRIGELMSAALLRYIQ